MSVPSWLKRLLQTLISLVALAALTLGVLVYAFGMHVEFAGNGMRPMFSFDNPDEHFADLEANRSQHYSRHLPPGLLAGDTDEPSRPYWTDFRGPARDGRYNQTRVTTEWPVEGLTPKWRQPIGGGYASFVVADKRAFTIEQRRSQEVVAAYELETGRELWTHAWDAYFDEAMGGAGPRATPTWNRGRLYALGATGRLWSLDAKTGDVLWERDILADSQATNLDWAMSGAPLVVDDLVVLQPGGTDGWSVVAYHRETGDVVWHALDDVQSYTSPMLMTLAGERQLVVVTAERVVGLTLEGHLLWEYPWQISIVPNIAQPVRVGADRLFLSASYGRGAAVIELTSPQPPFTVETVWENTRMKNKFGSSVLHDGYLYGLDESILACIDPRTGEQMWKGGRYGYGQLLLAGDHLIVLTERGELALVRATPEGHDEIARSPGIEGKTWNMPALADGYLLIRNAREMAAFDLSTR
jgi:outer membrane protein assembly factor BamB